MPPADDGAVARWFTQGEQIPRKDVGAVTRFIKTLQVRAEDGAAAVEYAIMAAAIAAVIVTTVVAVGTQVLAAFESVPPF